MAVAAAEDVMAAMAIKATVAETMIAITDKVTIVRGRIIKVAIKINSNRATSLKTSKNRMKNPKLNPVKDMVKAKESQEITPNTMIRRNQTKTTRHHRRSNMKKLTSRKWPLL